MSKTTQVAKGRSDVETQGNDNSRPRTVGDVSQFRWLAAAFLFYLTLIHLRFSPFGFSTLAGDDMYLLGLSNQENGFGSKVLPSLFQHSPGKWRPIPQVILSPLLDVFGGEFWKYQVVNELLLAGCGLVVAVLVLELSDADHFVAFIAGIFVVFTQFNLYHALQVLGLIENLAFLFSALVFVYTARFAKTRRLRDIVFAHLCFALAVHTHERFLVLVPSITLFILISTRHMSKWGRLLNALVPLAIAVANYMVKTWVLKIEFLVGAGGAEVSTTRNLISTFFVRATLNIFGFNTGPDYLSGRNAHLLGIPAIALALLWAVPVILVLSIASIQLLRMDGWKRGSQKILVFLLAVTSLLFSASISFRQEFRWLFPPFLALIVCTFTSLSHICRRPRASRITAVVILSIGLLIGFYYGRFADRTYFFETQSLADSIKDRVLDQYGGANADITVVIVTNDSPPFDWAIGHGLFFGEYAKHANLDIRLVPTHHDISLLEGLQSRVIVFENRNREVVQVSP